MSPSPLPQRENAWCASNTLPKPEPPLLPPNLPSPTAFRAFRIANFQLQICNPQFAILAILNFELCLHRQLTPSINSTTSSANQLPGSSSPSPNFPVTC